MEGGLDQLVAGEGPEPASSSPYAQGLPQVLDRLAGAGSMGVVVVGVPELASVERLHGPEARESAARAVLAAVSEVWGDRRAPGDLLLRADAGRDEFGLFAFRPPGQADFYRQGLPILCADLAAHLAKQGRRLLYPYASSRPAAMTVGWTVALHAPLTDPARQVHAALAEAREEGVRCAAQEARARKLAFQQVLLAEDLSILFEPIVNLTTRDVLGYEALCRGPAGSEVHSPAAFFGRAEEAGLLYEADALCRRKALEAARGIPPGRKLFVNCLPSAIRDPRFRGEALRDRLDRLHLRPTDVVFEISERESIGNFAIFREARDHFASLGLGVALDDTGVGYSSLEAVMELAPDFIKVDQVLVRSIDTDPPRRELLRALNAVAAKLGARLIAEGIETREELTTLQALGVPFGQGYLLGRAAPLRRDS